jgi:hypothetical protein
MIHILNREWRLTDGKSVRCAECRSIFEWRVMRRIVGEKALAGLTRQPAIGRRAENTGYEQEEWNDDADKELFGSAGRGRLELLVGKLSDILGPARRLVEQLTLRANAGAQTQATLDHLTDLGGAIYGASIKYVRKGGHQTEGT